MADQFTYPSMQQQAGGYPQFHYPTANGDQNAQLLQGYGLPQQGNVPNGPGGVFGGPGPYNFDQAGGFPQTSSVPVCQGGPGSLPPGTGGGFGYADFAGSFNQYPAGMGQNVPPNIALQAGLGNDMQHFGPLMNAFGQPMPSGAIFEAMAHEQGLAGINPMSFFQDPTGGVSRGGGNMARSGQRGGYNKFGGNRSNQNLPSVTNPDGLREDTVFVKNLPINIDHETMKAQFGVVGKIKINPKSGMPMVWIFKEKGIPKGEALVTFDDPSSVQSAIKHFSEREFLGRKVEVKQATNSQRPVIIPPGGIAGQNPSLMMGGGNPLGPPGGGYPPFGKPDAVFAAAAVAAAASGNTMASLMNNSSAAAASLATLLTPKDFAMGGRGRGGRGGGMNGGPSGGGRGSGTGSTQAGTRDGDWTCVHCCNVNFSWREVCNRCQASRAQDMMDGGEMSGMNPRQMPPVGRGGGSGNIPVVNAGQPGGFARGGPLVPGRGGGRGGGPMRGSGIGVGRARPAPY